MGVDVSRPCAQQGPVQLLGARPVLGVDRRDAERLEGRLARGIEGQRALQRAAGAARVNRFATPEIQAFDGSETITSQSAGERSR
jgi:hypothetical protein